MQIVIDIDEEIYNRIISWKENTICDSENPYIAKAIKNGTPLPKGHGDLIDVNRKITVPVYDEEHEEYDDMVLTVLEALNRWSDEGVTVKDVIIPADKEGKNE